jgi:site-specific recombinase XerD
MKTYFYLSRKKINAKGKAPIYCRIGEDTINRCDYSTGIFVYPKDWDETRGTVKEYLKFEETLLVQKQQKAQNAIIEASVNNITSAFDIVAIAKGKRKKVYTHLVQVLPEYFNFIKANERTKRDTKRLVAEFEKHIKTSLSNITTNSVVQFEMIQKAKGFQSSTIVKKQSTINRILKYCEGEELIKRNPYLSYKMPKIVPVKQIHVTKSQLEELENKKFAQDRLNKVKDLFLIQCYTGFAYIDLKVFTPAQITEIDKTMFIIGDRTKTGNTYYIPLLPKAEKLLKSEYEILSNQKYNSYLKEIAELMNWNVRLTTHIGRKTFAQLMINRGFSWEAVASMMGHAKTTMTERHYAKIGLERVQQELKLVA